MLDLVFVGLLDHIIYIKRGNSNLQLSFNNSCTKNTAAGESCWWSHVTR